MPRGTPQDRRNLAGTRVKARREELGWTQERLAIAIQLGYPELGITQQHISRIETGVVPVLDLQLDALARVLHVDPTWLLRG